MGIRCDKCEAYANIEFDENFREIEATEDCPISDEKVNEQYDDILQLPHYAKERI